MLKIVIGLLVGFAIGAGCRWLDIPVPSPTKIVGSLLVVAITLGYSTIDTLIARKITMQGAAAAGSFKEDPPARREKGDHDPAGLEPGDDPAVDAD